MSRTRVIILTSGRGATAALCLPRLAKTADVHVQGVVRIQGKNPRTKWNRRKRKLRKTIKIGLLGAVNGFRMRKWYWFNHMPLEEACQEAGVKLFNAPFMGSKVTEDSFREVKPDVGLSLGNGFIPEKIFSLPLYGMLNIHSERLPDYQNAQSVIWPIYNRETDTGITIHCVASGIDEGDIVYAEKFPICFRRTLRETVEQTLLETRKRTVKAFPLVCADLSGFLRQRVKQDGGGKYTTPSILQFARMERNNRCLWRKF